MTIGTQMHIPKLEVIGTVAQFAELAISAVEEKEFSRVANENQHALKLEEELDHERSENRKLRAHLDNSYKTLLHLQNNYDDTNDCGRKFRDCTAHLETCPSDLYERIRSTVDSSSFLAKLRSLNENVTNDDTGIMEVEGITVVNTNLEDPSWWIWVTEDMVSSNVNEKCDLDNEWYVIITDGDIVEAIATFIAGCIVSDPWSKKMTPEQLQKSLLNTFESMNKRNKIKKLWNTGKYMYSATMWGITAVGFYRHPFLLKAALRVLLASGRILVKAL